MLKLIVTMQAEDPKAWVEAHDTRVERFKSVATDISSYLDPAGGNQVGLSMTVTDQAALNEIIMSEETVERMRKHGGASEPKFLVGV
ncbi:hypothetical protein PUV47_15460 [Pseudovibrio exalbescens]|uniref:hypothetical protein n=1 Tax=Pseudovibrio exalbescens TaxID=197461 RepID=UPI002367284A|nr:hypothetical protein [Pseudovibrio exalbescens]MDD7911327.1 hypothetical protein [Pseudovibrio exalbescens]